VDTDYCIQQGALTITASLDAEAGQLNLRWTGKSIERDPAKFLQPLFEQWTAEAEKGNLVFSMDFSQLEYMNSSSVTPIIFLIQDLKRRNLRQVIRYDGTIKWQQLSFSALRVFTGGQSRFQLLETGG